MVVLKVVFLVLEYYVTCTIWFLSVSSMFFFFDILIFEIRMCCDVSARFGGLLILGN